MAAVPEADAADLHDEVAGLGDQKEGDRRLSVGTLKSVEVELFRQPDRFDSGSFGEALGQRGIGFLPPE